MNRSHKNSDLFGNISMEINDCKDREILDELYDTQKCATQKTSLGALAASLIGRLVRPALFTVSAAAVFVCIYFATCPPAAAQTQWGSVVKRVAGVDYFHYIKLEVSEDGIIPDAEGWFCDGKWIERDVNGYIRLDDGEKTQNFAPDDMPMRTMPSLRGIGYNFFEWASRGNLMFTNEQLKVQAPASVGDDFLLYRFDPPAEDADWLGEMSVSVGKNSLLPFQIKTRLANGSYWLTVFDFDCSKSQAEDAMILSGVYKLPENTGKVKLDGPEACIDLKNIPGVKSVIVKLRDRYDGPAGGVPKHYREDYSLKNKPIYYADITLVGNDGKRGSVLDSVILYENEGQNCGSLLTVDADGKRHCPQYRVRLRPTDDPSAFYFDFIYRSTYVDKPKK